MAKRSLSEIQKGEKETIQDIQDYIAAGYPLLYLYTTEELKTLNMLKQVAFNTDASLIVTFDTSNGLQCYYIKDEPDDSLQKIEKQLNVAKRDTIEKAIKFIIENIGEIKSFVIFKDMHNVFNQEITRMLKNLLYIIKTEQKPINILFISPILHIPTEIEKEVVTIDIPLPTKEEINNILEEFIFTMGISISDLLKGKFIEGLNGLTETEISNLISYCCIDEVNLTETDLNTIITQKQQLIKKGGILEFIRLNETIEDIGGLEALKNWLKIKKTIFDKLEKARRYGVDIPKGVLLYGMPGCGKSLAAKAIATYFEFPLLRLDIGMILGQYLGQSEENIRKAIKLAESVAPCILWIDELEKAFAGVSGTQNGNSETSTRIFGTILTWMQEKVKPVFVVATANDISGMPTELMRKGRFDEIFFVDFPSEAEAIDILKKHLKRRLVNRLQDKTDKALESIDFKKIAKKTKEFSGADIEAVVKEVIEDSFVNEIENITDNHFINKIENFKPISVSMGDKIKQLRTAMEKFDSKKAN